MKKVYIFLALLFVSLNLMALPDYGLWCEGKILMDDGTLLEGKVSYDLRFEVVRLKNNGMTQAFTAQSLSYFELYDPVKQIHRKYVSVDSPVYPGYKRKAFFEVISHGKLAMLRKSKYVRRPRVTEDMRAPHVYLNTVCKHSYYLHEEEKGLTAIDNFKEEVLPLMDDYEHEVNGYISRYRLKMKKIQEQLRVVNLYNMLYENESKLASNKTGKGKEISYNFR